MSENITIFILTGIATILINTAIFAFKMGGVKSAIKDEIITEINGNVKLKIDRIYKTLDQLNNLENSILELTAKLDLIIQKNDYDVTQVNERVTNLKNNVRSKIQDIKFSQNELINYLQKTLHQERPFIPRNRSTETISEFDEDSWTQIHD